MTKDLKTPLLVKSSPLLPPRPTGKGQEPKSAIDVLHLNKRGKRSWIRVDPEGNSQVLEVDKATIMRRCNLPARDLRLLDPHFVYPATILGREKALVLNLEHIRCIITADEVLLLNSFDSYVLKYVAELRRRLATSQSQSDISGYNWQSSALSQFPSGKDHIFWSPSADDRQTMAGDQSDMFSGSCVDYLPFEFRALEVALEAGCTFLDAQAKQLEDEAYPVLDELTSKVSTLNLERVRRLKSRLVALTRRVQKVRDEIEQLMDDDGDMAEMYLTHKMERMAPYFHFSESNLEKSGSLSRTRSGAPVGLSVSAPVSPVGSPTGDRGGRVLEKSWSIAKSNADTEKGSRSEEDVEELEMLLEAYFVVIDGTFNKLTSLKEYIDDTEDFINIQLDNVRNQLIQFELILTTATFVVAVWGVVAGVFGMNIPIALFEEPAAFKWVLLIAGASGLLVFCTFLWVFKRLYLLP